MRLVAVLLGLMPPGRLKNALASRLVPGWRVDRTAVFYPNLLWGVRELRLGPGAFLGAGNVFRSLRSVTLADGAEIGQFNWFSAAGNVGEIAEPDVAGTLTLDAEAGIVSRHYVDCSGGVQLGRRAIVGGVRSTVLSHSVDIRRGTVAAAPVRLAEDAMLLSGVLVGPGVSLARRTVLAGGGVATKPLTQESTLYGGTPAKPISSLADAKWFDRPGRLNARPTVLGAH